MGLGVLFAGYAAAALIEQILWLPVWGRMSIIGVVMFITALLLIKGGYYLLSIFFGKRSPDDAAVAEWVGEAVPQIRDKLRNAVQLWKDEPNNQTGYSIQLKREALKEAASDFLRADVSGVVNRKPFYVSLKFCTVSALLSILFVLAFAMGGAYRVRHPLTVFQKPLPFALYVEPGDAALVEGDSLILTAYTQGGAPKEIKFHILSLEDDESEDLHIAPMGRDSSYVMEIPGVSSGFRYKASSGRVESPVYRVEVKKPPMVRKLRVKLIPPGYSGFPAMSLADNVGDILALPGTKAEFSMEARGEIAEGYIDWEDDEGEADRVELAVEGNELQGGMKIMNSGRYSIRLRDREGLMNRYPIQYYVDVLPDLPPMVEIAQPGVNLELSGIVGLKLLVEGEDDFGLSRMELFYRRTSSFISDTSGEFKRIGLDFHRDVDGVFRADYLWELTELSLIPGDLVEYYAFTADNDDVLGPKTANSRTFILRLPTMAEMFKEMEQAESEGFEKLEEALEKSREIHEEVEKAINEIRRKGELDWSQKRNLSEKIKSQDEVLEKLEESKAALEEIMQRAEDSSLLSLELLEKYNELQNLISEIASPELMKALKQMSEALEKADPEKLRQAAEMFQLSQEKMLENIERSLQIMKQLKLERRLEELAERAAEMAERQEEITDEIAECEEDKIAESSFKEELLEEDMKDWLEKLEEAERLAAELDSIASSELDQLESEAVSLPGEMEEMTGSMLNNQRESAQNQGEQISEKLSKLSSELGEIKQSMISRKKEELAGEMISAVQDLVILSREQESLKKESTELSPRSARFREGAGFQAGIAEGLENVTNRLFELSQQTFFITPAIGKSLGNAAAMMQNALNGYTARNPRGVTSQQNSAMQSINRAAVQILDAISQMQSSSSSTGFSELMEKLQQMANQQAGLNQETQSMMMPTPGEGGMMSMEQMAAMGRMAAEQRALQRAMEDAAQQSEELGGVLGDLGDIGKKMGEAADSLEDKNIGERTLKLQERILSRLLDAQRSVRTQRISKQRQSRSGRDIVRRSPSEIPTDELEEMMRQDILRAMKEGYAPDYQRLIRDYFKALYEN